MSEFGALSVGLSGLEASQQELALVGQDVSNANTPGYVQERLTLSAQGGLQYPGFDHPVNSAEAGGVTVSGVQRLGDTFLQDQSLIQHSTSGSLNAQQTALAQVQQAFPEPSSNGISELFTQFFNSWDTLSQNPGDTATRASVISAGQALASGLNNASGSIAAVVASSGSQLSGAVASVNTTAAQVAAINKAVQAAVASGQPAGPLEDQRDALVSSLAAQVGVRVQDNTDGTVNLYVGNEALVAGVSAQSLVIGGTGTATQLKWSADGSVLQNAGGTIGGLQTVLNSSIPSLSSALDGVADTLSATVNAAQATGVTTAGVPGPPFFSGSGAAGITVAVTDPAQLAAASASAPTPTSGQNLDGSNAAAIGELATAQTVTVGGSPVSGPVAGYNGFITTLGGLVSSLNTQVTTQTAATSAADTAYANATGVNTDDEMTRMVQYQNAYSANAKYISTIASTIDSLLSMVQ